MLSAKNRCPTEHERAKTVYNECKKETKELVCLKKKLLEEKECKKLSESVKGNMKVFWNEVKKKRASGDINRISCIKDSDG